MTEDPIRRRRMSWFGHVCPHDTLPQTASITGKSGSVIVETKTAHVMKGHHQGMDRPVVVVVAMHRARYKPTRGSHCESNARSMPNTLLECHISYMRVARIVCCTPSYNSDSIVKRADGSPTTCKIRRGVTGFTPATFSKPGI